ncbi:MAG: hypothetical protein M9894_28945 [Planctomycetes bacterium]|nr:hypothetical protein [Planctomycetota bacterium]
MSTRGWYEYYVVDEGRKELALAFQFYKWGDATPENAIGEVETLRALTRKLNGKVPVQHVHELLRDNLGPAFDHLPAEFPLGGYYFLLQRAAEEHRLYPFRSWRGADLPREERPDYKLGFEVGEAAVARGFRIPRTGDPVIDSAHFSIAVGMLVRRWEACSTELNFLTWLQFITQITREVDMGCIAGHYERPWDVSFLYRFMFRVPSLTDVDQRVKRIDVELCTGGGAPLLPTSRRAKRRADADADVELDAPERAELRRLLASSRIARAALDELRTTHRLLTSPFWERRLPRGPYLGP